MNPFLSGMKRGLQPKPDLTLSQWAETTGKFVLPPERTNNPGPYRIGDATYQRFMLDVVTQPLVHTVVYVTSSQVGKTTVLSAVQGYYAEHEPSPQLSVWPNQITADDYVDEVFDLVVRDSPALRSLINDQAYPGGYIAFVGANNPRDLASRPIRVVTGDELDRWVLSSGKEGSPLTLALKRQTRYYNRKAVLASTPVLESNSLITEQFKLTRQHYFHVVCPHCGLAQILRWVEEDGTPRVIYKRNEEHKARYLCADPDCGTLWSDLTRRRLVREAEETRDRDGHKGGWRETGASPFKCFSSDIAPDRGAMGLWINELYSPYSSLEKMAKAETDAGDNPEKQKAFRNTSLALPWKGDISSFADVDSLKSRRERYEPLRAPRGVGLITASVDVQDDRVEFLAVGWGDQDEVWCLNHEVIPFDPSLPRVWLDVDEFLRRQYPHPSGHVLRIEAACVDSGGHFTQTVYRYCARHEKLGNRVHAIRGVSGEGKPIWRLSGEKKKQGVNLWLVGVDDAKTTVYTRFATTAQGPGYVHLHEGVTDAQCEQATAEICETEYNSAGFPVRAWSNPQRKRNEYLDLLVYNIAARASLNVDITARLIAMNKPPKKADNLEEVGALFR